MRIFRGKPDLSGILLDNEHDQQKEFVHDIARSCSKRLMNINNMEREISSKLESDEIYAQSKALGWLIEYLYSAQRGTEIAKDMFIAGVRALQKFDPSEALSFGERLTRSIFSVAVIRRMIGMYMLREDVERAKELLNRLPEDEWNAGTRKKIDAALKLREFLLAIADLGSLSVDQYLADLTAEESRVIQKIRDHVSVLQSDHSPLAKDQSIPSGPFDNQTVSKAANGSKNLINCLRLHSVIKLTSPHTVIEFGCNLGVSSAFMAAAMSSSPSAVLHTFEVSPHRINIARELHQIAGLYNVRYHCGYFEDVVPDALGKIGPVEAAFVDGDHTLEGTMFLTDQLLKVVSTQSTLIYDDITWSKEMAEAWTRVMRLRNWKSCGEIDGMGYIVT